MADVFIAGDAGGPVGSTLILWEDAALLADAQMDVANAVRLEAIFITHFHPDHMLGLDILLTHVPEAKPVAVFFSKKVVIPEPLVGDRLVLEGEEIEVLGPLQGDTALITSLYVPALDTLIATDRVYADTHHWATESGHWV